MDVTLRDMIYKSFSKIPQKQKVALKADELVPEKAATPIKVEAPKTVGDVSISAEAQRIFSPNLPPIPKAPNATQNDQGTAPSMDLKSKWDKGNE
jgi:hypothetical protein